MTRSGVPDGGTGRPARDHWRRSRPAVPPSPRTRPPARRASTGGGGSPSAPALPPARREHEERDREASHGQQTVLVSARLASLAVPGVVLHVALARLPV